MYSFDIDLKNGYMIIGARSSDKKNVTFNLLTLLDIKNKKKTLLAKSSEKISTSIHYPNVAFQIKDKIHAYNIEKKKYDFVISLCLVYLCTAIQLIVPNFLFPDAVRWAHFLEMFSSMLLFGISTSVLLWKCRKD